MEYDKASERPDYKGSRLNCFHVLLKERGVEWITNSTKKEFFIAMEQIDGRLNSPEYVKPIRHWSIEEMNYVMENYQTKSHAEMARVINRSANGIKQKINSLR